ncbi:hypothetical protein ACLB2K_017046 [Fragaria x ananassa]
MASLSFTSASSIPSCPPMNKSTKTPFGKRTHYFSFASSPKPISRKHHPITFSMKDEQSSSSSSSSSSSTAVVSEKSSDDTSDTQKSGEEGENGEEGDDEKQEMDWKTDEEFKRFMGNPSIEAAIKLEKKRADRKLKDLDRESSDNPIVGLLHRALRDSLTREKERLEKAEETFKVIDLNKVCMVQPKAEIDLQFEYTKLSTPWGYVSAVALCVATFGTVLAHVLSKGREGTKVKWCVWGVPPHG